jgi:hypothetical protein
VPKKRKNGLSDHTNTIKLRITLILNIIAFCVITHVIYYEKPEASLITFELLGDEKTA